MLGSPASNGFVIDPSPDWTTSDYLSVYSDMVNSGANPNTAGNIVLGTMIGQGFNPQLSQSALYNVAPFNATLQTPQGNAAIANASSDYNAWTGGITQGTGNAGNICVDGVCFQNPFSNSGSQVSGSSSASSSCKAWDVPCLLGHYGANALALLLGVIVVIFGLFMLKNNEGIFEASQRIGKHAKRVASTITEDAAIA